ncbi:hypothetical protein C8F04DRAFT_1269494 [Mycena alexandri]|uniref:RING-type domain-containing protein n=1 Tax=Mycena alexandri TaxID=1745969 RepID=A0AAD6SE91_9AGAR|nr:hypothetical protein C8F04DRAFT_1269494 [Mycena alexandri]
MSAQNRPPPVKGAADNPILLDENGRVVDSFSKSPRGVRGDPILLDGNGCVVDSLSPPRSSGATSSRSMATTTNTALTATVTAPSSTPIYPRPTAPVRFGPDGRRLIIFGGPPSAITRSAPRAASTSRPRSPTTAPVASSSRAVTVRRQVDTIGGSTEPDPQRFPLPPMVVVRPVNGGPTSAAQTRFRRWPCSVRTLGWRAPHEGRRFDENLLYIGPERPPVVEDCISHVCGICLNILSHPVKLQCDHDCCYVCIRQWLERSWQCPTCRFHLTAAPIPAPKREAAIHIDYPTWSDPSTVTFSWRGLKFPRNLGLGDSP